MKSLEYIYFETIDMIELSTDLLLAEAYARRVPIRLVKRLQRTILRECRRARFEAIEKYGLVAMFFEMVRR